MYLCFVKDYGEAKQNYHCALGEMPSVRPVLCERKELYVFPRYGFAPPLRVELVKYRLLKCGIIFNAIHDGIEYSSNSQQYCGGNHFRDLDKRQETDQGQDSTPTT